MPKRRVNRISKVTLSEVSAVDAGANDRAVWLLKSRTGAGPTIAFEPIMFAKGAPADDEDDDEIEQADVGDQDDAADELDDDAAARRKRLRGKVRQAMGLSKRDAQALRRILKAGDQFTSGTAYTGDANPGGMGYSESDRVGSQDNRTAEERAADLRRVAEAAIASPPAPGERFYDWAKRVFQDQLDQLDSPELGLAQKLYRVMECASITKKRSEDALMDIAKSMHAANPARGLYSHWAEAARNHPDLYAAGRDLERALEGETVAKATRDDHGNLDAGRQRIMPTGAQVGPGAGFHADDENPFDALTREAQEIRQRSLTSGKPLSQAQSFARACELNPGIYQRMRDAGS